MSHLTQRSPSSPVGLYSDFGLNSMQHWEVTRGRIWRLGSTSHGVGECFEGG
eukprot:CAMPEP_0118663406 /NCGR_PEP_ID=MMETSP0785-20121206/17404_1 /TAXON_ID=91992 /ORGANISM="Bolidomonas pacifica, Strain CCMP 1866" /LENGTH=51 /DNA_ID=CAMNT_0006557127 /DNA_START=25 /DNA_END=180 /DNA_ORIENTATION=+